MFVRICSNNNACACTVPHAGTSSMLWRSIPAIDKCSERSVVQSAVHASCTAWTAGLCIRLHSPALACETTASARCNILLYVLMCCYILDIHVFTANCLYMKPDCLYLLTQVWKASKFHFLIIWKWNLRGEMLPIVLLLLIILLVLCNMSEIRKDLIGRYVRNHVPTFHFFRIRKWNLWGEMLLNVLLLLFRVHSASAACSWSFVRC